MKTRFLAAIGLFLAASASAETVQYNCYGPDGLVHLDLVDNQSVYFKRGKTVGWLRLETASQPKRYPVGFLLYSGMFYEDPKKPARAWKAHVSQGILRHKSQGMFVYETKKHYCELR